MGQTSTTQGTKSGGLSCLAQKLGSTSTSCPSSGRTHVTSCLASPGPHTAEHSPASDTCHLWTRGKGLSKTLEVSRFFFPISPGATRCCAVRLGSTWRDSGASYTFPRRLGPSRTGNGDAERSARCRRAAARISPAALFLPHRKRRCRAQTVPLPTWDRKAFMLLSHSQCVFFDRRAAPH